MRKDDQVMVLAGKDRGKIGKVLAVYPEKDRALVENINRVKKHTRPNPAKGIAAGILEKEMPIHISNLQVICRECQKPTRVGFKRLEDGRKVRVCKKCAAIIDR